MNDLRCPTTGRLLARAVGTGRVEISCRPCRRDAGAQLVVHGFDPATGEHVETTVTSTAGAGLDITAAAWPRMGRLAGRRADRRPNTPEAGNGAKSGRSEGV